MVKAVQQIVKGSMSPIIEKSKVCEDLSHAVESFSVSKSKSHSTVPYSVSSVVLKEGEHKSRFLT